MTDRYWMSPESAAEDQEMRHQMMSRPDLMKKVLDAVIRSRAYKIKHNWTRENGAGFIAEDIKYVWPTLTDKALVSKTMAGERIAGVLIRFEWGSQRFRLSDLNLNETEELAKYLHLWVG